MHRFQDRVILVSGAVSALGLAAAKRLAEEGAVVVCAGPRAGPLEQLARRAAERGVEIDVLVADVSQSEDVRGVVSGVLQRFGRLDGLCNAAAVWDPDDGSEVCLRRNDWQRILAGSLGATTLMCREALPCLLETRGNIVNLTYTTPLTDRAWAAACAASRSGVLALTRTLAIEYGRRGLRVNAVCPPVSNSLDEYVLSAYPPDCAWLQDTLLPDDLQVAERVASAVAFLASDEAEHINGLELRVGATGL